MNIITHDDRVFVLDAYVGCWQVIVYVKDFGKCDFLHELHLFWCPSNWYAYKDLILNIVAMFHTQSLNHMCGEEFQFYFLGYLSN